MNLFELNVLDFIQEHFKCDVLDVLMPIITSLADKGIFFILAALCMLLFKKTRKGGIYLAFALCLGVIIGNLILKNVFMRPRPFDVNPALELLIKKPTDFSFPSGHSLAATEFAVTMLFFNKNLGIAASVLSLLICFSRLYLYVHYPSDVICAILLGIFTSVTAVKVTDLILKKFGKEMQ